MIVFKMSVVQNNVFTIYVCTRGVFRSIPLGGEHFNFEYRLTKLTKFIKCIYLLAKTERLKAYGGGSTPSPTQGRP